MIVCLRSPIAGDGEYTRINNEQGENIMGRQILLLGIGQSGCTVAELFSNKLNKDGSVVHAFSVDTDERTLSKTSSSSVISMTNDGSLYSVVEELGAEKISSWFPCDWENDHSDFIKNLDMKTGSNLWRMKAFLSFAGAC